MFCSGLFTGRTHRSNQVTAPEYVFLISELAGEQRFASIVAKRLESLVRTNCVHIPDCLFFIFFNAFKGSLNKLLVLNVCDRVLSLTGTEEQQKLEISAGLILTTK